MGWPQEGNQIADHATWSDPMVQTVGHRLSIQVKVSFPPGRCEFLHGVGLMASTIRANASSAAKVLVAPCCPRESKPVDCVLSVWMTLSFAIPWADANHAVPVIFVWIVRSSGEVSIWVTEKRTQPISRNKGKKERIFIAYLQRVRADLLRRVPCPASTPHSQAMISLRILGGQRLTSLPKRISLSVTGVRIFGR